MTARAPLSRLGMIRSYLVQYRVLAGYLLLPTADPPSWHGLCAVAVTGVIVTCICVSCSMELQYGLRTKELGIPTCSRVGLYTPHEHSRAPEDQPRTHSIDERTTSKIVPWYSFTLVDIFSTVNTVRSVVRGAYIGNHMYSYNLYHASRSPDTAVT